VSNPTGPSKTFEIPAPAGALRSRESTILEWVARILASRQGLEIDRIDKVCVSSGPAKSKTARIATLKIGEASTSERIIADIDAAVLASGHTFAKVEAFRPGEKTASIVRTWPVPIADDDDETIEAEPEPGKDSINSAAAGLLRQAHSHVDTYLNAFKGLVGETLQHHRETNTDLRAENRELRVENAKLIQSLSTREDERAERQIKVDREKALTETFKNIVTAIAVRLSSQGETVSTHLTQLLEGLSNEQQEAMTSVLNDDQRMLLISVFKTVQEAKERNK